MREEALKNSEDLKKIKEERNNQKREVMKEINTLTKKVERVKVESEKRGREKKN